ncbi:general transcription factor 3C polypeptide 1-like isoform X2 [Orbicella faveolata]|uniref:general transcription factor 3C polypeptide 1-like isoform X2 n=1 Tax=Orbicella faveolata TaxID=48498 RepID=UPI0009E41750|nr:general transcription factor 3C polypeptide 1-like isoform X2 [Orbicella faveolata]
MITNVVTSVICFFFFVQSFRGFDDPLAEFETTFQEVVKRLRQKFSSSSLSCDGGLTLVSSKNELHNKYKVQVLASKGLRTSSPDKEIASLGPSIKCVSDINKAAIRDQIQIAFTTPQDSYDAYRVFQMFNFYTREELEAVFKEMQKRNLITKKKTFESSGSSQFTRALPFASMTYQLSSTYHRLFMNGFKLVTFYRDCAHFCKQLINGEQHTFIDPMTSKSPTEETTEAFTPGTIELRPTRTIGGHVACILSLLATNKEASHMQSTCWIQYLTFQQGSTLMVAN